MCGRYTLTTELFRIKTHFGVEVDSSISFKPRYNIAPTQEVPIIVMEGPRRKLHLARFGLIPFWAKDMQIAARLINARSETVEEKPSFRDAFAKRRCIVPADSFIEWKTENGKKQPYRFSPVQGELFSLAGIWDRWKSPEGKEIESFSILTREASPEVAPYHDRMPVILNDQSRDTWLEPTPGKAAELKSFLHALPAPGLEIHPISSLVNSPRNDRPEALEPL